MPDTPIRVLLVDDDEDYCILTRDLLSEVRGARYDLECVHTYGAALAAMRRNAHDVYLLDYHLGARTGMDLLRECSTQGCDAPVILVTAEGDLEVDREAMGAGASDYLVKGKIDPQLMERAIRYAMERKRTQKEKEKLIRELQEALAKVKTLSGLFPICAHCKKIRDDRGYWNQIESYLRDHSQAEFTHGLCPECANQLYPGYLDDEDPAGPPSGN